MGWADEGKFNLIGGERFSVFVEKKFFESVEEGGIKSPVKKGLLIG